MKKNTVNNYFTEVIKNDCLGVSEDLTYGNKDFGSSLIYFLNRDSLQTFCSKYNCIAIKILFYIQKRIYTKKLLI